MVTISIVVPVYNSGEILLELNRQVAEALEGIAYELILVNDCSPDKSWEVISRLVSKDERVIGINLRKNSGQDNALMAGLNHCSGEYVVIMDDDLQHSPHDILLLVEQCRVGFDVCYANFTRKRQKWWKNAGSWLNGRLAEILIDKPAHIYLSPFEAIRYEVVEEIVKYSGPYPYVQGLILRVTTNITQVQVEHHERYAGMGNFNFIRSVTVFIKHATTFSIVPLRAASLVGSISAVLGFFMIPYQLYYYFIAKQIVEGWTSLMIVLLVIGGLILLSLGMLGEYVGRMYINVNESPQFVVKEVLRGNKRGNDNAILP